MHFWTVFPNERGRTYITLPGTITDQYMVDDRFPLIKWLASKLPLAVTKVLGLEGQYRYLIRIHFDDGAYTELRHTLRVEHLFGCMRSISNDSSFEITKETRKQFTPGQRVLVTIGLSSALDQISTGTRPMRFKLQPIRS